jgi:hypothetical protein
MTTPDNMASLAAWCLLPGGDVFYALGHNGGVISYAYIIDPVLKVVTKRTNASNSRYYVGMCGYYNGFVYVFSALNSANGYVNPCEKYSIAENKWTNIAPIPVGIQRVTNATVKNEIWITGNATNAIWKYQIEQNTFSNIYALAGTGDKVMCAGGGKVYLFENGRLLEFENEWAVVNPTTTLPTGNFLLSYVLRDGDFYYFILSDNKLYRFNSCTKKVDCLDTITY